MVTEYPEVTDWGRIPPERRGRWGRWLYAQRWLHGRMTQEALRDTLAKMGHPLSAPYYSEFEGGRADPNEEWQAVFVRLWGSEPPPEPEQEAATPTDLSALVAALAEQTAAINALVGLSAQAQRELVAEVVRTTLEPLWADVRSLREQVASLQPPSPVPPAARPR